MERYKNLAGNSGIKNYVIGSDSVTVQFSDGNVYKYSYSIAGKIHVDQMKYLARAGQGLNNYIMKNVYDKFD